MTLDLIGSKKVVVSSQKSLHVDDPDRTAAVYTERLFPRTSPSFVSTASGRETRNRAIQNNNSGCTQSETLIFRRSKKRMPLHDNATIVVGTCAQLRLGQCKAAAFALVGSFISV